MKFKDARMKIVNDILNGIKVSRFLHSTHSWGKKGTKSVIVVVLF